MTDEPRITFPCDYPIHVIGESHAAFRTRVMRVVHEHVAEVAPDSVTVRDSRGGNYCSVRFTIVATGETQLQALHRALLAEPGVRLVL